MNTKNYNLVLGSMEVKVDIKDIKNVHLSVYPPNGEVKVSAPIGTNLDTLRVYLSSRISWIKKQQSSFKSQKRVSPREFLTKESHYIRGKRYLMEVKECTTTNSVELDHSVVKLKVAGGGDYTKKAKIYEKWQRQELKNDVNVLILKWENILEVKASRFILRKMKTKWGSCNPDTKTININLVLLEKPKDHLEYVIVHELVHLIERMHNANFIAYMDKFLPNWKQLKSELNQLTLTEI